MHYKISSTITIKTENAAKPDTQKSAFLSALIDGLEPVASSFDYGCGKLRYKDAILRVSDTLSLVDSEIQISRQQVICGKSTTIRGIGRRSNQISVFNVEEFTKARRLWDRGFCINVLSVIPRYSERKRVLTTVRDKLRADGCCLFVVQYRNSDFTRMQKLPNAQPFRDGFLIDSLRGYSFYALIPPERLEKMVSKAGFEIVSRKLNQGSVYLYARRV